MTKASIQEDSHADLPKPEEVFRRAHELVVANGLQDLSAGMTNDWPDAIKQGSTFVRIGRAIFGM